MGRSKKKRSPGKGRSKKGSSGRGRKKKAEEPEEQIPEVLEDVPDAEPDGEGKAPEPKDVPEAEPEEEGKAPEPKVQEKRSDLDELLLDSIQQAWEDGVVTEDEMALLSVIKRNIGLDDEAFNELLEKYRPEVEVKSKRKSVVVEEDEESEEPAEMEEEPKVDLEEELEPLEEELEPQEEFEGDEDIGVPQEGEMEGIQDTLKPKSGPILDGMLESILDDMITPVDESVIESVELAQPTEEPEEEWPDLSLDIDKDQLPPRVIEHEPEPDIPKAPLPSSSPPAAPQPISYPKAPQPRSSNIITLSSSVRGSGSPLGHSFDLKKHSGHEGARIRCTSCRSLVQPRVSAGRRSCPVCNAPLGSGEEVTSELRGKLDQARIAFKGGITKVASELYSLVLKEDPRNKEALFYLRKLKHVKLTDRAPALKTFPVRDLKNIYTIRTGVNRLDELTRGGFVVGSQILLKGPAFCGKEVLLDHLFASALNEGFPVIYISSNRAMMEVVQGIVRTVPDFKEYNQQGRVRMYDLFSKQRTDQVLKEGHRIFNIEDRQDFGRFIEDIVSVQQELVERFGNGVMIMNSLSPIVSQADMNDLMKFLQTVIARSKGYRFTNVFDLASGIHPDSVMNSIEYLMEGIVEFREQESKNFLRIRGLGQNILSREWIEYSFDQGSINLFGSFTEERIV